MSSNHVLNFAFGAPFTIQLRPHGEVVLGPEFVFDSQKVVAHQLASGGSIENETTFTRCCNRFVKLGSGIS